MMVFLQIPAEHKKALTMLVALEAALKMEISVRNLVLTNCIMIDISDVVIFKTFFPQWKCHWSYVVAPFNCQI